MKEILYGKSNSQHLLCSEALSYLGLADWSNQPILWGYTPVYQANPYQEMLLGAMTNYNAFPFAVRKLNKEFIREFNGISSDARGILHVHWLNFVLNTAVNKRHAQKLLDKFLALLDDIEESSLTLVWTIHNVVPHETLYEDLEMRLNVEMANRAELIHIMSPKTLVMMDDVAIDPAKVIRVDHMLYDGVYPQWTFRSEARAALNLSDDEVVALMLGRIQPYKGLEMFIQVAQECDWTFILAGPSSQEPRVKTFLAQARLHPNIKIFDRYVQDRNLGLFYKAADVTLLPYTRSLNSGAAFASATFGVPIVMPSDSGTAHSLHDFVTTYDSDSGPGGIIKALQTARQRKCNKSGLQMFQREQIAEEFAQATTTWVRAGSVSSVHPFETP